MILSLLFGCLKGGQFPCTDDCQVTFVNLKCDSSKKRRRGRKSPSKEVSHITAEFEMEMKEEDASGVVILLSSALNTIDTKTLNIQRNQIFMIEIYTRTLKMDKCGLNVLSSESCNVDCVRERMKQRLQSAMRTLRKSITKQQFYIQFSGTEYEVAQKPPKAAEGAETCSTGQVLRDGKCGMFPAERVECYCFIRIYGSNLCISPQ